MNKLLIICGPTATGKTSLAISLAKTFHGELVSADSRQVYKGLDALTGKDRSEEVPIWLYDVAPVNQLFHVAHFVQLAQDAIDDIHKRARLPIVVGGTGFYLRALTTSIDTIAVPPDPELRKTLRAKPIETLQQQLRRADPSRWETLNDSDRRNPRRLIRAIEVARSTKRIPQAPPPRYDALWIGLTSPRDVLKQRITHRVTERFKKAIRELRADLPPILGAGPLLSYARGECTKEEALIQWIRAEYQYAKRQRLWFQKERGIHWFDVQNADYQREVEVLVGEWYT